MEYQLQQTGQEVQDILNQAPTTEQNLQSEIERSTTKDQELEGAIADEKQRAEGVESGLRTDIGNEVIRAEGAEGNLQTAIINEKNRAEGVEGGLRTDVDGIEGKIPTGASDQNKLATEGFVNSSISTNTADFKGTYNSIEELQTEVPTATANDYAFVISTDASGNTVYNRYKYVAGEGWQFEYALNNSSFTAAQWSAINSAITAALVAKLNGLPTAAELTQRLNAIIDSVATEKTRAEGIEAGLRTDVNTNAVAIVTEKNRAQGVEGTLTNGLNAEILARQNADTALQQNINAEALLRDNGDDALQAEIDEINAKIPTQASASNQLADKAFVNSSIATNTGEFKGTYNSLAELQAVTNVNANDYGFVIATDGTGNTVYNRYKYVTGQGWVFEYALNNSSFTAAQWGAINSGITAALAAKINGLPDIDALNAMFAAITSKIPANASSSNKLVDYAQLVAALAAKQDNLIFDNVPTENSNNPVKSGGVYSAIAAVTAAVVGLQSSKQDVLTFDQYPTPGSNNPVRSTGIYSSIENAVAPKANQTDLDNAVIRISTNEVDIAQLQAAYRSLTQNDVVPVAPTDTWPVANPQENVIYRVADRTNTPPQYYTDYMWNGSLWVLMATYNNAIDPRPKKNSQNLVTSGGVFDNMGALDVSELNATENPHTLAQYADLSAALAAIPTDYQKGGMSIKFVQSSDNKYVQARFMLSGSFTDAQFTNVDNWQGVDDEPTAGSQNLVESGGVEARLNLLDSDVFGSNTITEQFQYEYGELLIHYIDVTAHKYQTVYININYTSSSLSHLTIRYKDSNRDYHVIEVLAASEHNIEGIHSYVLPEDITAIGVYSQSSQVSSNGSIELQIKIASLNEAIQLEEQRASRNKNTPNTFNLSSVNGNYYDRFSIPLAIFIAYYGEYKKLGLILKFAKDSLFSKWEEWIYVGDSLDDSEFGDSSNWKIVKKEDFGLTGLFNVNRYLNQSTAFESKIAARLSIPESMRYYGVVLQYLTADGWINEKYKHSSRLTDSYWKSDNNWTDLNYSYKDDPLFKIVDKSSQIIWSCNDEGVGTTGVRMTNGNIHASNSFRYTAPFEAKKGDVFILSYPKIGLGGETYPWVFKSYSSSTLHPVIYEAGTSIRYVVDEDCYVCINGRTFDYDKNQQVIWLSTEFEKDYFNNGEFAEFYPSHSAVAKLANLKKSFTIGNTVYPNPITFLHLSDVHNKIDNYIRILKFNSKFKNYIDDVILSGDIAGQNYQIFDDRFLSLDNKVLFVLGNHDIYKYYVTFTVSGITTSPEIGSVYNFDNLTYVIDEVDITSGSGTIKTIQSGGNITSTSGELTKENGVGDDTISFSNAVESNAPRKACYDRYFANVSNWGVVQPSDAASVGKNYYYKDYTDGSSTILRLVVIDCMFWDQSQADWLSDVLNDALTNNIPIIGSQHFPLHSDSNVNKILCPFSSEQDEKFFTAGEFLWNGSVEIVETFINSGGYFVCWLCGHMHFDYTYWINAYPNQLWVSVASAAGEGTWSDRAWVYGTDAWDTFNVVSVDTNKKWLKVARFGVPYNIAMQHPDCICLDWNKYNNFNQNSQYKAGEVCKKDGVLYRFKFLHIAGEWNNDEVERYNRVIVIS